MRFPGAFWDALVVVTFARLGAAAQKGLIHRPGSVIAKFLFNERMEQTFRPDQLRRARRAVGLPQRRAAERLGVSQAYLALLEQGRRPVTARLQSGIAELYGLGPMALPLCTQNLGDWDSASLAVELANVGYPGFRRSAQAPTHNPATLVLAAIVGTDVEVRVIEALPWLAIQYPQIDWEWLIREAKLRDLQNRLGFLVALARQVVEYRCGESAAKWLQEIETILDRARLAREDTLCQASLSTAGT